MLKVIQNTKKQKLGNGKLSNKKIIGMGILIIFVLFVGIAVGGRIKNVAIIGCEFYTDEEIKEKVMSNPVTKNSLGLYLAYTFNQLPKIPFVGGIDINIVERDTVEIIVYEKTMIGCLKYMGEYLYFDKEGVVVESSVEKKDNVPVIVGVTFSRMNLYEKLQVENDEIFEKIMGISQLLSKYKVETDKILFDTQENVTLYAGKISVKLGKRERYDDQIAELSKLLPKAKKKNLKGMLNMENFEEGQEKIIFELENNQTE